jgi:DNA-binding transcriptional ArsR family regulator
MKTEFATSLPEHWADSAKVFAALGDSYRQRILLLFEPNERLSIKQISDAFPLSRSAMLHHVRVLQAAGLLSSQKEGREVLLSIDKNVLTTALRLTLEYAEESI